MKKIIPTESEEQVERSAEREAAVRYVIPAIPPSLNQFAGRENTWEYRRIKAEWIQLVDAYCRPRPEKPIEKGRW